MRKLKSQVLNNFKNPIHPPSGLASWATKDTPATPSSFLYSSACPPRRRASPADPIAFFLLRFGAGDLPLPRCGPLPPLLAEAMPPWYAFCGVEGQLIVEGESVAPKYYTTGTTPLEVLTLHRYGAALNWMTIVKRLPRSHLWGSDDTDLDGTTQVPGQSPELTAWLTKNLGHPAGEVTTVGVVLLATYTEPHARHTQTT
ncbi:hypothetical protein Taro_038264 [Colocasia esculenta]|uniref:Uncharacterized protein n=1 Tax=Colocasia esculenta TaxID=4460 RepID=A0A843WFB9_COLES|nr:hypothetical protein [Colocasia esculenta]